MTDYTERFRTLSIGQIQQVLATLWEYASLDDRAVNRLTAILSQTDNRTWDQQYAGKEASEPVAHAAPDVTPCYCSEYQSSGLPCLPGKCPNVPRRQSPALSDTESAKAEPTPDYPLTVEGHSVEHWYQVATTALAKVSELSRELVTFEVVKQDRAQLRAQRDIWEETERDEALAKVAELESRIRVHADADGIWQSRAERVETELRASLAAVERERDELKAKLDHELHCIACGKEARRLEFESVSGNLCDGCWFKPACDVNHRVIERARKGDSNG